MKIVTGKVVAGKVLVEGETLDEGAIVTVIAPESDEAFELDPGEEQALLASIVEAERGETVTSAEVLRELDPRG